MICHDISKHNCYHVSNYKRCLIVKKFAASVSWTKNDSVFRPMEMSSKIHVSQFREVIQVKKQVRIFSF